MTNLEITLLSFLIFFASLYILELLEKNKIKKRLELRNLELEAESLTNKALKSENIMLMNIIEKYLVKK